MIGQQLKNLAVKRMLMAPKANSIQAPLVQSMKRNFSVRNAG